MHAAATAARRCGGAAARPRAPRCSRLLVSASAAPAPSLSLHVGETTVTFPLAPAEGRRLAASIAAVVQTFAEKQKAERPKRWEAMEFRLADAPEVEFLEVFVNPNAHATAFDAKALVTLRTPGGVKVVTEAKLSALKADVDAYAEAL